MPAEVPQLILGEIEVVEDTGPVTRHYGYLEPDPATAGPLPLVLVFHGGGGNMSNIFNQLKFDSSIASRPFLTVFLQGDGPELGTSPLPPGVPTDGIWNSGHFYQGGVFAPYQRDDLAFVDAILLEMTRRAAIAGWRIDQSRTYAIGYSNGGMMAYRLAAERSSDFAAIAVVAASIGGEPDPEAAIPGFHVNHPGHSDAEPVSVMHVHGLLDTGVPVQGGVGDPHILADPRSDLPVADAIDIWVAHNGCNPRPVIDTYEMGMRRIWTDGRDGTEVQLLTAPGVGHQVPDKIMLLIAPFLLSHQK